MDKIEFFKNLISNFVANTHLDISLAGFPAAISVAAVCATVYGIVVFEGDKKVNLEQISVRRMEAEAEIAKSKGEAIAA